MKDKKRVTGSQAISPCAASVCGHDARTPREGSPYQ
jgi:hypothetical protein